MTNVRTECDGSVCPERRRRFEVELGYEVGRKISKLHDHRGILFVNWAERPSAQDIAAVTDAWGRYESDPITYHYENGVELVGCAPRYNPFDGSDQTHLAAIEHLRAARDLLKKTGKCMKQTATGGQHREASVPSSQIDRKRIASRAPFSRHGKERKRGEISVEEPGPSDRKEPRLWRSRG